MLGSCYYGVLCLRISTILTIVHLQLIERPLLQRLSFSWQILLGLKLQMIVGWKVTSCLHQSHILLCNVDLAASEHLQLNWTSLSGVILTAPELLDEPLYDLCGGVGAVNPHTLGGHLLVARPVKVLVVEPHHPWTVLECSSFNTSQLNCYTTFNCLRVNNSPENSKFSLGSVSSKRSSLLEFHDTMMLVRVSRSCCLLILW